MQRLRRLQENHQCADGIVAKLGQAHAAPMSDMCKNLSNQLYELVGATAR